MSILSEIEVLTLAPKYSLIKAVVNSQKGAVQFLVLIILLAGVAAGVYFIKQENFFNLFSKAGPGVNIEFIDAQGLPTKTTTAPKVTFKINFPSETYFPEKNTSSPITLEPAAVVLSEDPRQTINMRKYLFTGQYSVTERYTFSSSTLGQKTLYAQFIMKNGKRVNSNPYPATIELVAATASPTPSVSPVSDIGLKVFPLTVDVSIPAGSFSKAFDITSTGSTQFSLYGYPTSYGSGINWSVSSGGINVGQSYPVNIQVNSNIPAGTYTGTGIVKNKTGQQLSIPVKVTVLTSVVTKQVTLRASSGALYINPSGSMTISRTFYDPKSLQTVIKMTGSVKQLKLNTPYTIALCYQDDNNSCQRVLSSNSLAYSVTTNSAGSATIDATYTYYNYPNQQFKFIKVYTPNNVNPPGCYAPASACLVGSYPTF